MTTTTTTSKRTPARTANSVATYETPADVTNVHRILTSKGADKLTTDDLLVLLNQQMDAARAADAALEATLKRSIRDTVARYESIGRIIAAMFARHGRKGDVPPADHKMTVADARAMFEHLEVDVATTFGMSDSLLQVCVDAYRGEASALYASWSDMRASETPATVEARKASPSFYDNRAQSAIRWALARSKGNVDDAGNVLVRGNRYVPGTDKDALVPASEVKVSKDEASKSALAAAVRTLTGKRSSTKLIPDGPADLTVGVINQLDAAQLDTLALFISARREVIKATAAKHDAGKAAASAKSGRKVSAGAK